MLLHLLQRHRLSLILMPLIITPKSITFMTVSVLYCPTKMDKQSSQPLRSKAYWLFSRHYTFRQSSCSKYPLANIVLASACSRLLSLSILKAFLCLFIMYNTCFFSSYKIALRILSYPYISRSYSH